MNNCIEWPLVKIESIPGWARSQSTESSWWRVKFGVLRKSEAKHCAGVSGHEAHPTVVLSFSRMPFFMVSFFFPGYLVSLANFVHAVQNYGPPYPLSLRST